MLGRKGQGQALCARVDIFFLSFFCFVLARRQWAVSEELILAEVHPLDDVTAVVKDTPDILRVHSTGKMRIAIMLSVTGRRRNAEELVPDEILCSDHLFNQ